MLPDLLSIFESTSYTEFNDYYRIWFNFVTNGNFPFYLLFCFGNQLNWQFSYNFFSISITWISNAWQFIYINMDLSYTTILIRWSEKFIPFFFTTTPKKTTIYWFYKQAFFLVKEWLELWHVCSTKNRAFIELITEIVTKAVKVKCIAIVSTLSFHHIFPICSNLSVLVSVVTLTICQIKFHAKI